MGPRLFAVSGSERDGQEAKPSLCWVKKRSWESGLRGGCSAV